jgi:MFS family permease
MPSPPLSPMLVQYLVGLCTAAVSIQGPTKNKPRRRIMVSRHPSKPMASWKGSPFAVAVMFLGNGFVLASSYSRMPGIRDQLGSTPTQLAFALVCMGIGSILGMPITGRLVDRYSSRMISLVATVICLGGWAALPMARSVPELALMLLITGVGAGVSGVAMNVQGHLVEVRRRKVLMPFWHGLFSLGAVSGALAGALAASTGLPIAWQLPGVSMLWMVALWWMPLDRALLAVAVLVLLIAILASVARERGEESIKAKDGSLA